MFQPCPPHRKVTNTERHACTRACVRVRSCSLPALPPAPLLTESHLSHPETGDPNGRRGGNKRPLKSTVQISVIVLTGAKPPDSHPHALLQVQTQERGGLSPRHSLSSACTPGSRRMQGIAPHTSGQRAECRRGRRGGRRAQVSKEGPSEQLARQPRGSGAALAPSQLSAPPPPPPQPPVTPGSVLGGSFTELSSVQAWPQRQMQGTGAAGAWGKEEGSPGRCSVPLLHPVHPG